MVCNSAHKIIYCGMQFCAQDNILWYANKIRVNGTQRNNDPGLPHAYHYDYVQHVQLLIVINSDKNTYSMLNSFLVFMGRGLTSGGQESWCAFGAVVCKIQARKHYIKYFQKIKEAASLKVKCPLYSWLLVACLPSGSRTLN